MVNFVYEGPFKSHSSQRTSSALERKPSSPGTKPLRVSPVAYPGGGVLRVLEHPPKAQECNY